MTSSFDGSRFTAAELRSIAIGRSIHEAVVDEGRREGVFAYLYHDGKGRAWFEKYDRAARKISRKFSPELMERMKRHRDDMKVYARYCEADRFKDSGAGDCAMPRRVAAMKRCVAIVSAAAGDPVAMANNTPTPPPAVGTETTKRKAPRHGEGLRHLLTNEK